MKIKCQATWCHYNVKKKCWADDLKIDWDENEEFWCDTAIVKNKEEL